MIHPALRLIVTQPHLLAEHVHAYGGLVGAELGRSAAVWKLRLVFFAIAAILLSAALVLGGVSLMLWAITPAVSVQSQWALIAVPSVPAVVAVGCLLAGMRKTGETFENLKQQLAADMAMLREVHAE